MQIFTQNSKTILSVDFDRKTTCGQHCSYCYVENMERIYPAYKNKIIRNATWAKENGKDFAVKLNQEYRKLENSRSAVYKRLSKLPIRIYGAGDFISEHTWFLIDLDFKFFIISKNLTTLQYKTYVERLLTLDNLTSIVLSFDEQNILNYKGVSGYLGKDRMKFAFTGIEADFNKRKSEGFVFDIFFNISKKKVEREKSAQHKEACPCDSGKLAHKESCSYCSKCWK